MSNVSFIFPMTYERTISAISFGDTKAAALYFDRVIPLEFRVLRGTGSGLICEIPDPIDAEVLVKLIFGDDSPKYRIISYLDDYWSPLMNRVHPLLKQRKDSQDPDAYAEIKELYLANASGPEFGTVRAAFGEFAQRLGVGSYSVLLPSNDGEGTFSQAYSSLAATNVPLVDTSKATWGQVMEFRSDPDSRAQLRRLRLFFTENYLGKSRTFIEDDLLRRIDDYERARKKHGFEAVLSSLAVLLDADTMQAAAVASLASALFGGVAVGVTTGAAVELGKVLIELGKKQADIRDLAAGHELGYVIRAKENL